MTVLMCVLLLACDERQSVFDLRGQAMGTTWSVQVIAPDAETDMAMLRVAITAEIERIEAIASTYRTDSEVSRFNAWQSVEWFSANTEFCEIVVSSVELSQQTRGAYDITVAPLVNLWGFGPLVQDDTVPEQEAIRAAQSTTGFEQLQADCAQPAIRKTNAMVTIDLSASAKGWAVDAVAQLLADAGVRNFVVEIGGEVRLRGKNADQRLFAIAIENPTAIDQEPALLMNLTNTSVATSGDYRNYFEQDATRYSHIIDPRTGNPVTHNLASVTVVSASAMQADAMATALLTMGPNDGLRFAGERGIAAFFQVRTSNGDIEQMRTPALNRLLAIGTL